MTADGGGGGMTDGGGAATAAAVVRYGTPAVEYSCRDRVLNNSRVQTTPTTLWSLASDNS